MVSVYRGGRREPGRYARANGRERGLSFSKLMIVCVIVTALCVRVAISAASYVSAARELDRLTARAEALDNSVASARELLKWEMRYENLSARAQSELGMISSDASTQTVYGK